MSEYKYKPKFPYGTIVYITKRSCSAFYGLSEEDIINVPMVVAELEEGPLYNDRDTTYIRPADKNHKWYKAGNYGDDACQYVLNETLIRADNKPLDPSINEAFL